MLVPASRFALFVLALLVVAGVAAPLAAQDDIQISGVVKAMQGNRLEVQTDDRSWVVVVDGELLKERKQETQIEFHGRGRGSIVERGMWVRFFADLDAMGRTVGPVRQLTWFTPDHLNREGAFPAEPREDGGEPVVHWTRPLRGEIEAGHYLIVASVRSVKAGLMDVYYLEGERQERHVFAQLAADVDITIDISHREVAGKLISPGDTVEVRGLARENRLHAQSLVVQHQRVEGKDLVALAEKPTRRPTRTNDNEPQTREEPVAAVDPTVDEEPVAGNPAPTPQTTPRPAPADKPERAKILRIN